MPLFVAAERGLFAHQGLKVKLKSLGNPVHVRFGGAPAPSEYGMQVQWPGEAPGVVNFEDVEVLESYGFDLAQRAGTASRLVFVHPVGVTPVSDMIMALTARADGARETPESAAITPEIYYCRGSGAGK